MSKFARKSGSGRLPTGSTLFDLVMGGGYLPGRVFNLVGDKSSGKTLLAAEAVATARRHLGDRLVWVYDDAEAGFSFDSVAMYGFDLMRSPLYDEPVQSTTVEAFEYNLRDALDRTPEGYTLIYVLDSLDSLSSAAELERADDAFKKAAKDGEPAGVKAGTYGTERAKAMSELFRVLVGRIDERKAVLVVVSQVRENIGVSFGEKYRRAGGKALDFYASAIVWLSEVEKHRKKGLPVGVTTKVLAKKNKTGLPFRQAFLRILFDYGVDDVDSCIDYLFDGLTEQGKARPWPKTGVEWNGQSFKRRSDLIRHIEDNGHESQLRAQVKAKWNELEASIKSERKRKF